MRVFDMHELSDSSMNNSFYRNIQQLLEREKISDDEIININIHSEDKGKSAFYRYRHVAYIIAKDIKIEEVKQNQKEFR